MRIVGVTSTKVTFTAEFTFLESKKKIIVTWTSEVCQTMLKDQ